MTEEERETPEEVKEEPLEETRPQNQELETLKAQLSARETELINTKRGLSTAHATITEKDKELKRRVNLESQIAGIQDTIELLTTAFATKGEVDNLDPSQRQDILAEVKKKRDAQEAKRKEEEDKVVQQDYTQRANTLYTKAIEVYGDDDDSIDKIADLISKGWIERAAQRVAKAEQKKPKENMETEEQRVEKLAQERLNKYLEERGLLEEHSSLPSASGSASEAMSKYIAGDISADEAMKRGAKFR